MSELPPEEKEPLPPGNTPLPGPDEFPPVVVAKEKTTGFVLGWILALPWMFVVGWASQPLANQISGPNNNLWTLLAILFGIPIIMLFWRRTRRFGLGLIIGQISIIILFFTILFAICSNVKI